jgi:hypothetical protein
MLAATCCQCLLLQFGEAPQVAKHALDELPAGIACPKLLAEGMKTRDTMCFIL